MLKGFFALGSEILSILYTSFYASLTRTFNITTKEFKLAVLGLNPNYYILI